ncbi:MAG: glutamyl-tRNA reductase [Rectinemataceae bacterium]|jgi:glutamyl-tRNA reductase
MSILCLGISHRAASVELRERMSLSPDRLKFVLAPVGRGEDGGRPFDLSEMAILSTCNRFEVYAVSRSGEFQDIDDFVSASTGVPKTEFLPQATRRENRQAVTHLFRVSSGLDSMVLGETQVLGQVTEAYEASRGCGSVGPLLSALFRAAIHAGKRAHTETAISRNAASVGSVAARLAAEKIGDISNARIVVIGAGEMAELAVEALRHRDAKHIAVVNRTRERAEELAARWQAEAFGFEHIVEALNEADIVVSSTGAPHVILTRELVGEVMKARPDRPLILIDIAVPRDVDPGVNELRNAHCYDIDDLETRLSDSLTERHEAVPEVEAIIEEEADDFMGYLRSLDVVPVITALRAKAEEIRRVETEKALRQLAHLSDEDRARIDFLGKSILDRFLHKPTLLLKAAAGRGQATEYSAAISHVFELSEDEPDER